jgi:HK97 family phage major capsid protein
MLEYLRQRLAALLNERAELAAKRDAVLAGPTEEKRDLTAEEAKAFEEARTAIIAHDEKINEARARISVLEEDEKRQAAVDQLAADLGRNAQPSPHSPARTTDPDFYPRHGDRSYFRDLMNAQMFGNREANERLARNDQQVADQIKERIQRGEQFIGSRALTTTDGGIGEFVPPLWMIDEYVRLARAGRVFADQLRPVPLPPGTDSINLPRLATGTAVAEQATQNTAVQNTDATTNSISSGIATIAGQQVVSVQLLEQSPLGAQLDNILLADLAADYATKLDVFALSNNASGKLGVLSVSGISAVAFTTGSPTVPLAYAKFADAIQRVATNRFLPAQKIFMHPRRWAWFLAALDTSNRPLVVPAAQNPQNAAGTETDLSAEGYVGTLQGLPVYQDPNIPTGLGAGTNEDIVIVARTDDIILFESTPRSEAFREPLAAQLSVLLRFYNYASIQAGRYPKSISTIGGTGFVAPTF